MATLEEEKSLRDALVLELKKINDINAKDLARETYLGTQFSFAEGVPFFERILSLYTELSAIQLEGLPYSVLASSVGMARDFNKSIQQVHAFDPKKSQNPNSDREKLINNVRDQYEGQFKVLSGVLAYSTRKGMDFKTLERNARETVLSMQESAGKLKLQGEEFRNEAKEILQKLQDASAEVGVGHHSVNFKQQADEHYLAAHRWFWTEIIFIGIGLSAIWLLFLGPLKLEIKDLQLGEAIYSVASRLMAFSVISFAIYWAAKNHSSHRHNYIVNKHRQNALVTFQTFIDAAGSDQTVKNAVLLQAGQAIYATQPTGYSENIQSPASPVNLIEVIKNVSGK